MKNKPNFFFDNRAFPNWRGGSATWEFFQKKAFFSDRVPNSNLQVKNNLIDVNSGLNARKMLKSSCES